MINWALPKKEKEAIALVCAAFAEGKACVDSTQLLMDVTFVHKFRHQLDFAKMIIKGEIWHDIGGIHKHLDRATGELGIADIFVPRCVVKSYSDHKNPLRRRAHESV